MPPISGLSDYRKIKSLLGVTGSATALFVGISLYQGNEKFYDQFAMPFMRLVDPEIAHRLAINTAKFGLSPTQNNADPPILRTSLWGLNFNNPLGMAAGFDKHAEAVEGLHKMGFGFVEIGSVTPKPQDGNPKPRVFRLSEDKAIINRYGFNSEGHDVVHDRLAALKASPTFNGIIGVNLGKNKDSTNATQDYVDGIIKFSDLADYFVVNVSSPNTPGLRNLQGKKELEELLSHVNEARSKTEKKPPLLLKVAPDLSKEEMKDIAAVIMRAKTRVDGLVVSNTTLSRENLLSEAKDENGGLSGAPIASLSTRCIANMYQLTNGRIPIIGVGGIFSGADAYGKLKAGASLIQIYTAFTYHGPPIVGRIKRELSQLLHDDGINNISEVVGKEAKTIV
ncbi:dihydroorotate dehydrogenase (quinone), mitochondrial [Trichogramma pretiosum]|uniref:dihydroorotate dehydrogenase (quinone), mitochondrial n=1 Tax=Trichogramma pretiosum TaxID=7493 RepID=UPI0006C9A057|nr:dihydroorotate dehydrogenase (quinone), mitochondrial [Trichogramma pretiosum]XP_014235922.1 dihydroorotate dehydrogenase (quinone), mitochondrial [Trichogramma pretiosum]XP_023313841.1 dihydroorotate dehydrogenase (quinone), mitochondrial [Trichogramma pretiosum]